MYCSQCGREVEEGNDFCTECGQPVKARSDSEPVPEAVSPATAPTDAGSVAVAEAAPIAHKPAIIACIVVAVIAVVAILCVLVFARPGSGSVEPGQEAAPAETLSLDGVAIKPLSRPKLVNLKAGSEATAATAPGQQSAESVQTMVSPALAPYVVQANGESSSDIANESASSGSSSGEGQSAPAGEANVEEIMENPYADLEGYAVDPGLSNVVNADDFRWTSSERTALLEENLFVVNENAQYSEYFDLYEMNRYDLIPNFVTVDSMMHTYHLYFAYLLKNTESGYLYDQLEAVSQYMLEASLAQYEELAGTEWEDAAKRNMVFFGVGLKLLNPAAVIPDAVAADVGAEVALIEEASNPSGENVVTSEKEDYTQYIVRGYYEETERLSRYFRAMMWYGRTAFLQKSVLGQTDDEHVLNRCALLMTLAMEVDGTNTANTDWETIYAVTSFFAGASDDSGFYEYLPLVKAAYGDDVTVGALPGNEEAWNAFNELTAELEPPKISSVIVEDEDSVTEDDIKSFRFMGQRFSIDESVFQQLIHNNVTERMLPSAMDLPAALGSTAALDILESEGKTAYEGYEDQLEAVREDVAASSLDTWSESLYASWLYTLCPLLLEKGEGYPAFMVSGEWDKKDLQTFLASYTELKHDTVLYSKQVMAEMGGGVEPKDDRGYVEPEAEVYSRLAQLVAATSEGLQGFGIISAQDIDNLAILQDLATQLETISVKELQGETLSADEYELIRSYGGQLEHFWDAVNPEYANGGHTKSNSSPAAVVVDIATDGTNGQVLQVATGKIAEIWVVAPVAGQLKICSGGVPVYYEFTQPQTNRLTDSEWREMLGFGALPKGASVPDPAEWTQSYTAE